MQKKELPFSVPGETTVEVVRGQLHKFMLIPIMDEETQWIEAGPILFGIEARAFGKSGGDVQERGPSVHVLDGETREEWLRFDCFDGTPHYHYILNADGHNVVWGYDPLANGPMAGWIIAALRARMPEMLRQAGGDGLARRVEKSGIESSVYDQVAKAMVAARDRTFPGTDMIDPSNAWYRRWKEIHPQFNTV